MTDLVDWIEHRMRVLDIETPAALAEVADLGDESFGDLWAVRHLGSLQQSQCRRLACALQTSLKKLHALDQGTIRWIDDADRYLACSASVPEGPEILDIPNTADPAAAGAGVARRGGGTGGSHGDSSRPQGFRGGRAAAWADARHEAPQGTPVLGRIGWDGRIDRDECWDEQWGRRLPDGRPQRQDTYALETELAGQFVVVRNAAPWEAQQGSMVALYVWDGFDGVGYFGQLLRGAAGGWRLCPTYAGQSHPVGALTLAADQVQRVGRLVRRWPAAARRDGAHPHD